MPAKHNLPSQPTPFIGREREVKELLSLLDKPECRLVTLVGPGGIGKTRLALEVAARLYPAFEHGVAYVALAPVHHSTEIAPAIVNALGIHSGDAPTPLDALLDFLRGRHLLLLLDNIEHLLDGADQIIDILAHAPRVKVLTTSREMLNVQEEWVLPVRGLRFPDGGTPSELMQYGALQLFIERARRVQHDFSLEDDLDCAIEICRLVDGMPLALELAASWLKTLSCTEIVAEIQAGIDILVTNVRNIEERHRSIRTVFDYSWGMCTPDEQAVFRKLCVFRGGFEREAAEQVAGASLLILTALVEKSMLWKLPSGRYKVHELLRQYAQEKLDAAGEADATRDVHMRAYSAFMQSRTQDIKGRRQFDALNEIDADFGNIRLAWTHAIASADTDILDMMMEGLALFCDMRARYQVGDALFKKALDTLETEDHTPYRVWNRLRARWIQVWILQERIPLPETIADQLQQSLETAKAHNDAHTVALCLWISGELNRFDRAHDHGIPAYEQALEAYQALEDTYYIVRVLRGIVHAYFFSGDESCQDQMIVLNQKHLKLARQVGDRTGMAHAIYYEGSIALFMRRPREDDGEAQLLAALAIWQEMGDRKSIAVVLSILGILAWLKGDNDTATERLDEALTIAQNVNFMNAYGMALAHQGFMMVLRGDVVQGKQRCEESMRYHRSPTTILNKQIAQLGLVFAAFSIQNRDQARNLLQEALGDLHAPLGKILTLPISAFLLAENGDMLQAIAFIGLAHDHPLNLPYWMDSWQQLNDLRDDLRTQVGQDAFDVAWERGSSMDLETAIASLADLLDADETTELRADSSQLLIEPLSDREREVLALLSEGFSNKEIADQLVLAVGTVKVHTRNIYGKLGVGNRTEAAAIARKLDII